MKKADRENVCIGDIWRERDHRATVTHALVVGFAPSRGGRKRVYLVRVYIGTSGERVPHSTNPRSYFCDRIIKKWERVRFATNLPDMGDSIRDEWKSKLP